IRQYLTELDVNDPKTGRQLRDYDRATAIRSLSDRKQPEYREARQLAEPWSSPLANMIQAEEAGLLHDALERLHPREALFLRLRYGFDGCPAQTLSEVGQLYGLTRERVRQIQCAAEERLRHYLCEEMEDESIIDPSDE